MTTFVDYIGLFAGCNSEFRDFKDILAASVGVCGMDVSSHRSKEIVNTFRQVKKEKKIHLNGVQLEKVQSATLSNDGSCVVDVLQRITAARATTEKLKYGAAAV